MFVHVGGSWPCTCSKYSTLWGEHKWTPPVVHMSQCTEHTVTFELQVSQLYICTWCMASLPMLIRYTCICICTMTKLLQSPQEGLDSLMLTPIIQDRFGMYKPHALLFALCSVTLTSIHCTWSFLLNKFHAHTHTLQDAVSPVLSPQRLECPPSYTHYRRPSDEAVNIIRNFSAGNRLFYKCPRTAANCPGMSLYVATL
jgi:hypothetical protein